MVLMFQRAGPPTADAVLAITREFVLPDTRVVKTDAVQLLACTLKRRTELFDHVHSSWGVIPCACNPILFYTL
jgi:hypothetical protein